MMYPMKLAMFIIKLTQKQTLYTIYLGTKPVLILILFLNNLFTGIKCNTKYQRNENPEYHSLGNRYFE